MDFNFKPRKTGKDKERRTRELYCNHSAKHVRIQEHCQENHLKNLQEERNKKGQTGKSGKDNGKR